MYKYQITKYNPKFKDAISGRYLRNEWTAISDIGKTFCDGELSSENYKKVEDSYIRAIFLVMDYLSVSYLVVDEIIRSFSDEKFMELIQEYVELYTKEILDVYYQTNDMDNLYREKIDSFCRLLLREDIGAKLFYKRKMKVFIGYDYLMGIHSSKSLEKIIPQIEKLGLYIERIGDKKLK